jgi:thiol-disulfide isomerase/thioredoxin
VRFSARTLYIFALLYLAACSRPLPQRATWKGSLQLSEGKQLAFRMDLDLSGSTPIGHFIVGTERTPIPEISRNGDSLAFSFSEYGAEMRGTWDGGELKGNYLRHRSEGTKSFPFVASPEDSPLSKESTPKTPLPLGNHEVHFQDDDGSGRATVARLWTEGNALYGTFIAPDGDYGLLEGTYRGSGIQLSRFTGWQAILIELEPDGPRWAGRFHAASNEKPRAFTLGEAIDLDVQTSPAALTSMKKPESVFEFSCSSLSGETVRHSDERFKGKALVVDIMGTWCHNCLDEAPILQQIQKQFGKDGLEVVGLSFEIADDAALGKKNLTLYRDRFALTYPLLFCGNLDDANLEKRLKSQLDNFFAFPSTLFIDKKGRVQTIHTGFRGPGTGELFSSEVQKFNELASEAVR